MGWEGENAAKVRAKKWACKNLSDSEKDTSERGASEIVWSVRAKWLWLWWGSFCFSQSSPQPRHLGCKSWRWRSWWWWWWWWWGTSSWQVYCERSENCKIWLLRMPNLDFANFWTTQHPRQRSLALINLWLCPARGSTNWLNQSFGQIWEAPFTIYGSGYPNTYDDMTIDLK